MTRDGPGNGNDLGRTDSAHRGDSIPTLGHVTLPPTVGAISFYPFTLAVQAYSGLELGNVSDKAFKDPIPV